MFAMKKITGFKQFTLLFSLSFLFQPLASTPNQPKQDKDPLLAVVIMVKDEEPVICATLDPYVKAGIKNFLVFDTGSTDKTIQVTQEYFAKNNLKSVIKQEPFIDFSVSRNRALQLANEAFPQAGFFLMPDAEWYMNNVDELLKFCQDHQNDTGDMYGIRLITPCKSFFMMHRLIKAQSKAYFDYPVHEYTIGNLQADLPKTVSFEYRPTSRGIEKSGKRLARDLELLLKKYNETPNETRAAFFIGQTYTELNQLEDALTWYKKRVEMNGWDEEVYVAQYRVGNSYEALGNWEKALSAYHKAFSLRPSRIEPLIRIASHYWKTNELNLCYLYAKRALEIPLPAKDIYYVEKDMYDFARYNLVSISAWYAGDYEGGKTATEEALRHDSAASHLYYNLNIYNKTINAAKPVVEKPIAIISVGYNNKQYYKGNLDSTLTQDYKNYRLIYVDADSPDGTADLVREYLKEKGWTDRVTLIKNEIRCGSAENIYNAIQLCKPEEIIVMVEADDQLAHNNVLKIVNQTYHDPDIWLTYGDYTQLIPTRGHCSYQLPDEIIKTNSFRDHPWITSHLRTYYGWLAQQIKREDCMHNGKFYPFVSDLVIMFPMLEMAGSHSRFIPEILYIWNNDSPLNEGHVNARATDVYADFIRSAPRYIPLTKSLLPA